MTRLLNIPNILRYIVAKIGYAFQMTQHFDKNGAGFRTAFAQVKSFQMIIQRFFDPHIDLFLSTDNILHRFGLENFHQR